MASLYKATVHSSIAEIDRDEWQSILKDGSLFRSHEWMVFLEYGVIDDYSPRYIVFRDGGGRLVAHASAYLIDTSLLIFSTGILKTIVSWIRFLYPRFMKTRVVECGCPLGASECLSLLKGVQFADIADELNRALETIAVAQRSWLIVVRDFTQKERASGASFSRLGFAEMPNIALIELPLKWKTFDEYAGSMRATYRKLLRKRLRLAQEAGLSSDIVEDFGGSAEFLAAQRQYVAKHAKEYSREVVTPNFYRTAPSIFGSRAKLVRVANEAGQVVSHSLVIVDGPVLRALQFGREPQTEKLGAYFLVTADIIKLGIELGCKVIDMGLTTHSPKLEFGGNMVPLWMFVKIRGTMGPLIIRLLRLLNPVSPVESRRVFRSDLSR
jgi:predicted N-acyltransferase